MNIVAFVVMFLMMFAVEDAKCQTMSFLERYNLSTTVIKADTAPTDEVYSWWTESAKKCGMVILMRLWLTFGCRFLNH